MPSRALTESEKARLAPYIPDVDLEHATVHEGKVPWYLPKRFGAITRGRNIYFRCGVYSCETAAGIALLAHEMVHVGQYRVGMTAIKYLWSSRRGYSEDSRYEKPAYDLECRIFKDLLEAASL